MGVAAYNRGSQVVRRQADADVAGSRAAVDERHLLGLVEDLREKLTREKADLQKARFLIERLRVEKKVLQDELRYRDGQLTQVLDAMRAAGGTGVARIMAAMTTIDRLITKDRPNGE